MKVTLAGRDLDLDAALPLTLGDLKKLKQKGVDLLGNGRGVATDVEAISTLILYVANKLDPAVTMEDVDALDANELSRFHTAMTQSQEGPEQDERPT